MAVLFRRYSSRDGSATNCLSSTFPLLSACTSCCVASRTASRANLMLNCYSLAGCCRCSSTGPGRLLN